MVRPHVSPGIDLELTERHLDTSECVAIIVAFLKTLNGQKDELRCKILVWEVGIELAVACELDRRPSTFVQVQELLLARPLKMAPGIYLRSSCWSALMVLAERDETERLLQTCLRFLHGAFGNLCERPLRLEVEKALSWVELHLDFDSHMKMRIMPALNGCTSGTHDHSALLQSQREVVDLICHPAFVRMVNWTD
jgi:hypothetical protein